MDQSRLLFSINHLDNLKDGALQTFIRDWLIMIRLLLEPQEMAIDGIKQPFDLMDLHQFIDLLTEEEDCKVELFNQQEKASLHIVNQSLFEKIWFSHNNYRYWEHIYLDYLNNRLEQYGVFAYIRSYDEYLYHNTSQIEKRRVFDSEETLQQLPKMKGSLEETIVDCNQFPGFDVFLKGLCLTSCWRLFFGEAYKQLFPKQLLLEIQQVEKVAPLGRGVFLELYKDPFAWQEESNLHYQELFRQQIGVPQLSYTNGVGILKQPYIEYAYDDTSIQTVQYQNDLWQPIGKKEASYFVTRTYNYATNDYHVHRMEGKLNALAYFPWIDDANEKMMNFRVLYPELTLDQGLSAYEFYIRDYLDLNIEDERLKKYTAVLQIFIPSASLVDFPLDKLVIRLQDVDIKKVGQKKDRVYLMIHNGQEKLKVLFLPQKFVTNNQQVQILEI